MSFGIGSVRCHIGCYLVKLLSKPQFDPIDPQVHLIHLRLNPFELFREKLMPFGKHPYLQIEALR